MKKQLFLIESISLFQIKNVIEASDEQEAKNIFNNLIDDSDFKEFSQKHLGVTLSSITSINSEKEYFKLFDKDNDYLKYWSNEQKLSFINKAD